MSLLRNLLRLFPNCIFGDKMCMWEILFQYTEMAYRIYDIVLNLL